MPEPFILPRPAVFIDRDDTLVACMTLPDEAWRRPDGSLRRRGDLLNAELLRPLEGARAACQALRDAGYRLVVVTNQGGAAFEPGALPLIDACGRRLRELLVSVEGEPLIDAVYACPFHPGGTEPRFAAEHPWRKPAPGMIRAACRELHLDPLRSWAIGDKERDLQAAIEAGVPPHQTILVDAEYGLAAAAEAILVRGGHKPGGGGGGGGGGEGGGPRTGAARLPDRAGDGAPEPSATPPADRVEVVAASTITLHAAPGALGPERVRETVLSTAHAIAERTGVRVLAAEAADSSVTVTLATHRLAALGFASELRRLTEAWHAKRSAGGLWSGHGAG